MTDFSSMPDDEFELLAQEVNIEADRRLAKRHESSIINQIQEETQRALGIHHAYGEPWVQPTPSDRSTMYAKGQVVTHLSRVHASKVPYNHWEPDVEADHYFHSWSTVEEEPALFEEWDPSRAYDNPAQVTRENRKYALIHHFALAGWDPKDPTMHAVWKDVTPA